MLFRRKKNGQSAIEFTALVIIVLMALFVFQKYILRGFVGRWKGVGDAIGQGKIYDPNLTTECRFASFFPGSSGQWFDQKCFESNCITSCVGSTKSSGACSGCLSSCLGSCAPSP